MSCTGCAKSFGLFNKELCCENCGFSFCGSCLTQKAPVSKAGGQLKPVCKGCYKKIHQTKEYQPEVLLHPKLVERELEKLDNPSKPPIVVYKQPVNKLEALRRGLSAEDQSLIDRLEKLKEERIQILKAPSIDEMAVRLAKLKGVNPEVYTKAPSLPRPGPQNPQDLIQEAMDEIALDGYEVPSLTVASTGVDHEMGQEDLSEVQKYLQQTSRQVEKEAKAAAHQLAQDKEVQARLAALKINSKAQNVVSEENLYDSEREDDPDRVLRQVLEKAALDRAVEEKEMEEEIGAPPHVELPWCVLCNEDATLQCPQCEGDLYCARCFRQSHDEFELNEHFPLSFKAPA